MGMAGFSPWVESNWFNLIQTVGIIGSVWMACSAAHREAKAREIENLLTISDHHRELWNEAYQRKDLQRVFACEAEVLKTPATVMEEQYLNLVIIQYETGWKLAKAGGITKLQELSADVRGFFSLLLPCAFWKKTSGFRNQRFVRFVEKALG